MTGQYIVQDLQLTNELNAHRQNSHKQILPKFYLFLLPFVYKRIGNEVSQAPLGGSGWSVPLREFTGLFCHGTSPSLLQGSHGFRKLPCFFFGQTGLCNRHATKNRRNGCGREGIKKAPLPLNGKEAFIFCFPVSSRVRETNWIFYYY